MVSHAVWKTWLEGLGRQKPRPKADVFVVTEAQGLYSSHGIETMIKSYHSMLADWFFAGFYSHKNLQFLSHFIVAREVAL